MPIFDSQNKIVPYDLVVHGLSNRILKRDYIISTTLIDKLFSYSCRYIGHLVGKQNVPCTTNSYCPVDCEWKDWKDESDCTKTCGFGDLTGIKHQRRAKSIQEEHGGYCNSTFTRLIHCTTNVSCPNDCQWSNWSDQTQCSKTCGLGALSGVKKQTTE